MSLLIADNFLLVRVCVGVDVGGDLLGEGQVQEVEEVDGDVLCEHAEVLVPHQLDRAGEPGLQVVCHLRYQYR